MTIEERQNEIVEDFSWLEDWSDKYKHIIDLGKEAPVMPEAHKTEDNRVRGCQSQVWLHASLEGDRIIFEGDSDALIVKGLVTLLLSVYSGHTPDEILGSPMFFIEKIGLSTHLSPTRSNGLASMLKQIKNYAIAFKAAQQG